MPGSGKSILVTGGGGYIGSHCILQLLHEDFNVIVVDNFVNSIKGKTFFNILKLEFNHIYFTFLLNTDVNDPEGKKNTSVHCLNFFIVKILML